ncbi:hypothetical protein Tco_0920274, partial [Tanacetum coccineum]
IWKAFGGNTRDLGSFGEETDKTTDLHQHLSRISTQKLETASQITRDAVTTHLKTASQDLQTASECLRKPAFVCIAVDMSRKTCCKKGQPPSGNSMAHKSIVAISHGEKEELRKKGIKSPSKLFSQKYLSPASIKELKKNPSALKRVHFVNSIVILSTDSDTEEEDTSSTNAHEHKIDDMVRRSEGIKEQGKEDDEIETDMEVEEVIEKEESEFETDEEIKEVLEEDEDDESFNSFLTMKELTHHEWLLKHPRPPWEKAKVRAGSLNNIKISCMNGHIFKRHAYIDLESPINIVSRHQYNQIMTYGLRSSFAYECEFMILEDTSSIIDRHLGEMVFGKPFIDETGLVYDEEKGTVMFEQGDEKITFKIPYTMEIFKKTWLMGLSTNSIPPSVHEENFDHGKTHYYQSLLIGDGYKQDKGDRRGIRHLMRLEKEMMDNKG